MPSIPLNRIVAFAGPILNILMSAITTWLVSKARGSGLPFVKRSHPNMPGIAGLLAGAAMQLGQAQWLRGHHEHMAAEATITAANTALIAAGDDPPVGTPDIHNWIIEPDVEAELAEVEALENADDLPEPIDLKAEGEHDDG